MIDSKKDNTEAKILYAAQSVFLKKGMDGTRMQEIADEAGINKALLHYYFRTKQKLFEAIFKKVFLKAFPDIKSTLISDLDIKEKLTIFIDRYISMLIVNPFLPHFIIKEINRDPEFLSSVITDIGINAVEIIKMFGKEMDKGTIRRMDPREIMINILALSVFPFAVKPLMKIVFFQNDNESFNEFLEIRKVTVKEFVLNSILLK